MVTLALVEMFFILAEAVDFRQYTGADDGLHGFPVPAYLSATDYRTRFYFLALVFFAVVFLAARRLVNSPTGFVMIATRDNENRAMMIGYKYSIPDYSVGGNLERNHAKRSPGVPIGRGKFERRAVLSRKCFRSRVTK
ncbi:MAG TPA: hypothetical protein ENI27_01690 [bacterium]|nr:hypothetical protein [bacterium]